MRWPILALMPFVLIFIASQTTAQNGVRLSGIVSDYEEWHNGVAGGLRERPPSTPADAFVDRKVHFYGYRHWTGVLRRL